MPVIERMPDSGRVVVAHPSVEANAVYYADRMGLDVLLCELAGPPTHFYVMDIDAILNQPIEWKWSDAR